MLDMTQIIYSVVLCVKRRLNVGAHSVYYVHNNVKADRVEITEVIHSIKAYSALSVIKSVGIG